jgi:Amt family ammonium transporter
MRAVMACYVTNLAASVGGLTWLLLDYRIHRKFSALGFCSGAVSGLVAITPGAGFIGPGCAIIVGFLGAIFCNGAIHLKHWLNFDDAVDVFAVHGVGGFCGSVLTGFFAESYIANLDGSTEIKGGWMNHNWIQIGYQFADATAGALWSFVITYIILFCMNRVPGLSLRVDPKDEIDGLDMTEIGELAYFHVEKIVGIDTETGVQTIITKEIKRLSDEEEKERIDAVTLERAMSDPLGKHKTGRLDAL